MPSEKPLLHFIIEPELLDAVDSYRYQQRIPTRAKAVKELLRRALALNCPDVPQETAPPPP